MALGRAATLCSFFIPYTERERVGPFITMIMIMMMILFVLSLCPTKYITQQQRVNL